MRKTMQREITKTTVKLATMEIENGLPVAKPLEDVTLIGNVSLERAQSIVKKEVDPKATVFEVVPETNVYEMDVEEFIKHATLKTEQEKLDLEQA